jgi:integrase
MTKLTVRTITAMKKPGLFGDGNNLFLKIDAGGSKSWVVRVQRHGKVRTYGLGAVHTVSLADARTRAAEVRRQLLDGIDPRRAVVKVITFDQAAARYIASHRAGWKNAKHIAQWPMALRNHASPVFGRLPVDQIDVGMVMQTLSPIWTSKNATAFRLRGRIEAVLAWAKAHGYRSGENPAQWRGNLDHLLPPPGKVRKTKHHAALPYAELPAFMAELRSLSRIAERALEFAILTAARTSEVLGARWSEIDLNAKVWTISAERMKSAREHRVPLCERAVAIVAAMPRNADHVFPGIRPGQPLGSTIFLQLLRRLGRGDITAHGFRSTFRDWAAETTNYQNHVVEMALAHAISNQVEASYRRGDLFDKRRQLMAAWDAYCESRNAGSNVVALR